MDSTKVARYIEDFMAMVVARNPNEPEFHQAVHEVVESLAPFILENPALMKNKILERMTEPERLISFRVPWVDDKGEVQINRGYRVQMSSAIGPYKGGLRFHASVNQGILKFLAFEQVLKNSLTSLPMGGGKGGSDFNPKGKSDQEVMRFCQSFVTELYRHVGPDTDVPAGDIGVGGREIGFIYGQYKRLVNAYTGTFTGKGPEWGGSPLRPEATGYGTTYFAAEMLKTRGDSFKGKTVCISGSGNVAQYAVEKVTQMGGIVVTLSDSSGFIHDPKGITPEKLEYVMILKNAIRGRIREYVEKYPEATYYEGKRPWSIKCDIALPCATQNELNGEEAQTLVNNGCICVAEGANMPSTPEAIKVFLDNKILYGPGKAANAGGVATSGLEMSQNSMRMTWTREEVDQKLQSIMKNIHAACVKYGQEGDFVNYVKGANISGFIKVANAMMAQGIV
ncbi:glutamate dehydrogenase (NADP+) [Breznakibacter xylanolyticus]|uniref:Glutamate dehydrogenase n=1 Tax=Breznakibacter xylanolyticus TaxID=990 RepID=A0A2W7MSU5_9BACT|nr:NADP-specific glutamate dehydrogenase [Breznakibacter xylanolyticus]MBN2743802.1 NADP-specific glutamate dehydrogenase [Marinilabiliaceae bacterium]PZX10930.1 glutamate dehydrogenase (NADP+) [Breznakibacter xylanolyticus]